VSKDCKHAFVFHFNAEYCVKCGCSPDKQQADSGEGDNPVCPACKSEWVYINNTTELKSSVELKALQAKYDSLVSELEKLDKDLDLRGVPIIPLKEILQKHRSK